MERTNEPSPADGDRKIENNVKVNFDQKYDELLKKEQEAMESKITGEATVEFDKVRKLGFATKSDIDSHVKGIFGKFVSEIEAMRQENLKLREWVMRAKMHGLNSGATEENKKEENRLKAYERYKW